jgi:phospholipase/carboxylesterase
MNLKNLSGPRVDLPAGETVKSLMIICHGYGSNGYDLISLVPHMQPSFEGAAFAAPNAPEICQGAPGGYQWFALSSLSKKERLDGTLRAAPILDQFIDQELERYGLEDKDLLLAGFSQGTMMALHVGLRRPNTIKGILGFSGSMSLPDGWENDITSRPPIQLIHGDRDQVLPLEHMTNAEKALKGAGLDVRCHISKGIEHSIGPCGLNQALGFLEEVS